MKSKRLPVYDKNPEQGVDNEYPTTKYAFRQPCLWYISAVRNSGVKHISATIKAQPRNYSQLDTLMQNVQSVAACATGRSHFRKVSGELPDLPSIRPLFACLTQSDSEL